MSFLNGLKLITFDVTNTLLKFRTSPGTQYGEIGAMYGVLRDNSALSNNFKNQWKRMSKEHPNFGLNTGIGWEQWWREIVKGTFSDSKSKLDDQKVDEIFNHLLHLYKNSSAWQHNDGALELLSFIQSKGIPIGIISNFDPRLEPILINTKLRPFFNFVLTSYNSAVEKPNPAIFQKAMEIAKINNLKPQHCLHIGDDPHLDYLGAKKSGWHGVLIHGQDANILKNKYPEVDIDTKFLFGSLFQLYSHLKDNRIRVGDK